MDELQKHSDYILQELKILLKKREDLLRKETLSSLEDEELITLNDFVDNLPISLDSDINSGFQKIRDFANALGKSNYDKTTRRI